MHVPDGILSAPVLGAGAALAAAGVAMGLRRMDPLDAPRTGLVAAVFFVASLVHVPLGPSNVHLVLHALAGLLLGWSAFPALLAALLMQSLFLQYGGLLALGVNTVLMAAPAVACHYLFAGALRRAAPARVFLIGACAGAASIVLSCALLGAALGLSGRQFSAAIVALCLAHLPVLAVEAFVVGSAVAFLRRVCPGALGAAASPEIPVRPIMAGGAALEEGIGA